MAKRLHKRDNIEQQVLRSYIPEPTARRFHACNAFVRCIMGPVGTGKTVVGCMEAFSRALEQTPDRNKIRRSRWAFVRNTGPELQTTTLKTWQEWIPESICPVSLAPPISARLNMPLADGTRVDLEIIFLAMDRDDDIKKMKSLELTGVFLNEASEIRKSVFDIATSRVNRFPSPNEGGSKWAGVIMDTNPPDITHWIPQLEAQSPEGFRFFRQPPIMVTRPQKKDGDPPEYVPNVGQFGHPPAEGVKFHAKPGEPWEAGFTYWKRMIAGKDPEWVKVFVMGEYGTISAGRPVYHSEFNAQLHVSTTPLETYRALPLITGWDFGLNASVVIGQVSPKGQLRILAELTSESMGIRRFVKEAVKPFLLERFSGMQLLGGGDPAGGQRSQTTEDTCFQILAEEGLDIVPACSNNEFVRRREAVVENLTRLIDGKPGLIIDPSCTVLIEGFKGQYHFAKLKLGGVVERYQERPEKNKYSHIHDAMQYLCLYIKTNGYNVLKHDALTGGPRDPFLAGMDNYVQRAPGLGRAKGWV